MTLFNAFYLVFLAMFLKKLSFEIMGEQNLHDTTVEAMVEKIKVRLSYTGLFTLHDTVITSANEINDQRMRIQKLENDNRLLNEDNEELREMIKGIYRQIDRQNTIIMGLAK